MLQAHIQDYILGREIIYLMVRKYVFTLTIYFKTYIVTFIYTEYIF